MAVSDSARELDACTRQRAVIAELGQRAISGSDIERLLSTTVAAVRDAVEADSCAILEFRPDRDELSLRAGAGWDRDGASVETESVSVSLECQLGYALAADEPIVVDNLTESRFQGSALLADDAISGISVAVESDDDTWGVLSVHATRERRFSDSDVGFVEHVASLIGAALEGDRSRRRDRDERSPSSSASESRTEPGTGSGTEPLISAQLRDERLLNERILETSPVGITVIGADGDVRFANERAAEILGRDGSEITTYSHDDSRWDIFDEAGEPIDEDALPFSRVIRTGESVFDVELGLRRGDGTRIWLSVNGAPLTTGGEVTDGIFTFEDVTERWRLEGELESTFDRITDACYGLDTDWNITYANEQAKALIDPDGSGLVGENIWDAFPETTSTTIEGQYRRAMRSQEPVSFEEYYPLRDTWYEIHAYPSPTGLSVYFRDVTEQKRLEYERRETNRTLQRLYAISSDSDASFEEKVDRVLELGCEYLDVTVGFVAAIDQDDDRFEILRAQSESELIRTGIVTSLSETYCRRTIESDELLTLCNAPEEGWADDVAYDRYDFDCYLGGKVIVDGDLYGTLCFCDTNSHNEFTRAKRTIVELITQWISYELERVERERALTKYETIVETVDDGIYTVDEDGRFTMVNEAYADLVGYARDELLGEHVSLVADEETVRRTDRIQEALVDGDGDEAALEAELLTKNGNRVLAEGTYAMLSGEDDRERVGVVRDTTERRARERRLEESEHRYRTLVEHFPNGAVGLFDDELRFTVVGGQLLEDLAIDPDEPIGTTIFDSLPPDLLEEIEPSIRNALEGGRNTVELTARSRNLLAHTVPVRNVDGEVFAGMVMVQDVTERKQYQRRLEESNERLEQFAYAASHDLQEPLRMVSSYLQLIEGRYGEEFDEDGEEFLAFAVDGADRMREMIDGLLTYSRIDTRGDPLEPLELDVALAEALANLEVKIEESDAQMSVEDLPLVRGDRGQLRQVFQNLVSNAITYCGDEPPRIHVSAERAETSSNTVTDSTRDWIVSVRDEGIGIDTADTGRIFEVFNRLHSIEEYSGTGIGLALCQRIVERHGGEIWVDSEPGEGATFSFTLSGVSSCGDHRSRRRGCTTSRTNDTSNGDHDE